MWLGFAQTFAVWQACFLVAGLSLAWLWAAARRASCARAQAATAGGSEQHGAAQPAVTVVLPVTGTQTEAKLRNARAQLRSAYAGYLHFVFAVESAADPAVRELR